MEEQQHPGNASNRMQGTEETPELSRDELIRELACARLRLKDKNRNAARSFAITALLVFLIILSVIGFSCTVYFITKEQTAQIHAIFNSDFCKTESASGQRIEQDAGDGGTAVINNRNTRSYIVTNNRDSK